MWPFKSKNTYKITYQDTYGQLCSVLVEATTVAKACRKQKDVIHILGMFNEFWKLRRWDK